MDAPKLLVIGGVAAGASFAARARRLNEYASITIFERGPDVSFAGCGLPYHIGGEIRARDALAVQTPQSLKKQLNLNVLTLHEAIQIDRQQKRVLVKDLANGQETWHEYDKLMIAPGATPIIPPIPGIRDKRVLTLRNLTDMDHIIDAAKNGKSAIVVGAGFIGLEVAEQLTHRGLKVSLVELQPQVMPPLDEKMTLFIESALKQNDVSLYLGEQLVRAESSDRDIVAFLKSGKQLAADFIILSAGVSPETALARHAQLALGERGHIQVNGFMQTSDPDIYAAGDAIETFDAVFPERPAYVPLGGPANRQGRIAADHIFMKERARPYPGALNTAIVRVFNITAGMTGWSEKRLQKAGIAYGTVTVNDYQHATYFPGAQPLTLKICWEKETGRLLGAQASGLDGIDKRLDVLSTAITAKMHIEDLCHLELAYAPPFGAAKDIVNLAGFAATNLADGLVKTVSELPQEANVQIIDVRPKALADRYPIPGTRNIPFAELRTSLETIDRNRPVITLCSFGKMSYFAARVLTQHGFNVSSYAGGIRANIDVTIPPKL